MIIKISIFFIVIFYILQFFSNTRNFVSLVSRNIIFFYLFDDFNYSFDIDEIFYPFSGNVLNSKRKKLIFNEKKQFLNLYSPQTDAFRVGYDIIHSYLRCTVKVFKKHEQTLGTLHVEQRSRGGEEIYLFLAASASVIVRVQRPEQQTPNNIVFTAFFKIVIVTI